MKKDFTRRQFIKTGLAAGAAISVFREMPGLAAFSVHAMKPGLVTYLWGQDWDLPTLIGNCEKAGMLGVELRVDHAHKVESSLTASERADVKRRFADSSVICVGYGSNYEYHSPDPAEVRKNIEGTKEYIKLCSDIGASGIKVKPNGIPEGVPKEKTITQIAASLDECGRFAGDHGLLVRVEVHGAVSQEIPNMKAVFERITEPNVKMCWNCNDQDLLPPGLDANFSSVKQYFGDTIHVRELNEGAYPYQQLFNLLTGMRYDGWILLEARTKPADRIAAMKEQIALMNTMIENSLKS